MLNPETGSKSFNSGNLVRDDSETGEQSGARVCCVGGAALVGYNGFGAQQRLADLMENAHYPIEDPETGWPSDYSDVHPGRLAD